VKGRGSPRLASSHRIVQSDSMHTTPHHPPAPPTTPQAPRCGVPCRRDGPTDRQQRQKQGTPTLSYPRRADILCKEPPHATPRHDAPLLLYDGTQRGESQRGRRRALPLACDSHHITSHHINQSLNQSITQPTNFISNVSIVISHQLMPPLLYNKCSHTPSM
jgi:hypothetical protein